MSMRIESASLGWSAAGLRTASLPVECAQCHEEVRAEIEDMCSLAAAFLHYCCECSKHWRTKSGQKAEASLSDMEVSFDASPLYVHFLLKTEGVLSTVELLHLLETIDISDSLGQSFWKNSNTASEILSSSETICFNLRYHMLQNVYGAAVHETY